MTAPRKKGEMPMWASLAQAVTAREPQESAPRKHTSRYLTFQGFAATHVGRRGTNHLNNVRKAARCTNDQQQQKLPEKRKQKNENQE